MSRSRRKTPVLPFSSAASEKEDKALAARRARRAVKVNLETQLEAGGAEPEHRRSGQWNFGKDGKRWVEDPPEKRMRK